MSEAEKKVKEDMREQQAKDGLDQMKPVYEEGTQGHPAKMLYANKEYNDEYKVGHNKPPLFLIVLYILVIIWCAISWIPFYGY